MLNLKCQIIICSLIVLTIITITALAQSGSIFGAYQDCPFHCRTIRINSDFTFEYRLDGDLHNNERYRGTWKLIGRNIIKVTSPEEHSPPQVTEKSTDQAADFHVSVIDVSGAIVPGAEISGLVDGSAFRRTTNENGSSRIPKCQQFEIAFNDYRGTYKVVNPNAHEFLVTLTYEQMANWAIDQVWLIEGNRLYIAAPDGAIDKSQWLKKLSRKKEREIFR
jgi:hypothetical protein